MIQNEEANVSSLTNDELFTVVFLAMTIRNSFIVTNFVVRFKIYSLYG